MCKVHHQSRILVSPVMQVATNNNKRTVSSHIQACMQHLTIMVTWMDMKYNAIHTPFTTLIDEFPHHDDQSIHTWKNVHTNRQHTGDAEEMVKCMK